MSSDVLIQLTDSLKLLYIKTAQKLKGTDRRQFMAAVVRGLGVGGQTRAERELGWNRLTIRLGMQELTSGQPLVPGYQRSGRKRVEVQLPHLLEDIQAIVDPHSQTDPSFKSTRLYTRLSAAAVRRQLLEQGYQDADLPSGETIRRRLNELGYTLKRVAKIKPQKRIPETDAIFAQLQQVNQQADAAPPLRISMDAKVAVNLGEYDRGGKTRTPTQANDHDFDAILTLTLYGLFLPEYQELSLFFVTSKVTADRIVDLLEAWWQQAKDRFAHIHVLVINQDNGPENHFRRTQFMQRLVTFAHQAQLKLQLAYYPPYHSKYNPVERTFGWLEQHWNGSLLDSVETVLGFAQALTFKGMQPVVTLVETIYQTGVIPIPQG
ncbi:ISAzo13 family transposase [Stenomitos frigidus]|uniref:ISAzo13 family transposase n=1 Tax=Stenomitos frigidus TaxID=1886765 RepID=UPI001C62484D|nr:ISAzo13 family transposase [Stenomitos frigidus]